MASMLPPLAAAAIGYLFGSIPFGLLLSGFAGHGDIRRIGSGNIGATNVLRTGNQGLAVLTLLLDATKGAAAVAIGQRWGGTAALAAAGAAVIGHMFPIWLRFRGGKGVATALGVLLVLVWPVALVAIVVWLIIALWSRYASLAALAAAVAAAGAAVASESRPIAAFVTGLAILVLLRHHANVRRLLAGTESRISLKKG